MVYLAIDPCNNLNCPNNSQCVDTTLNGTCVCDEGYVKVTATTTTPTSNPATTTTTISIGFTCEGN